MITYKILNELREAGFTPKGGWSIVSTESGEVGLCEPNDLLSQLIEACGERFVSLERCYGKPGMAYGDFPNPVLWWEAMTQETDRDWFFTGPTPEEAVARLWLALNAQKSS